MFCPVFIGLKMSYKKYFAEEFELAKAALKPLGGEVYWVDHDYEAFRYKADGVLLIFYPHQTTAGNHHLRVRCAANSNIEAAAIAVKTILEAKKCIDCKFQAKIGSKLALALMALNRAN